MSSSAHSHMMKTTRRGRPFVKDTHDLFSTLIISLPLDTHRSFFKTYPHSFTTDEAAANLSSLKFSQSNRSADPKDPTRIITTTTTTTFSMSRDMAKGICQHFMDAHLIENATDLSSPAFKDRGVYMTTPKGLHILERFVSKNGIAAEHILQVFAAQPVCIKLLHLERRSADDEIIITKSVIEVVWRRFAGKQPNASRLSDDDLQAQYQSRYYSKTTVAPGEEVDRTEGLIVRPVGATGGTTEKTGGSAADEYQFSAWSAIDWLCDYTTCVGADEAAELAAQFVRYGLITLVSDKGKVRDTSVIVTVRAGGAGGGAGGLMQEAEYRATDKAIYKFTREGMALARWQGFELVASSNPSGGKLSTNPSASASKSNLATPEKPPLRSSKSAGADDSSPAPSPLPTRRPSMSERSRSDYQLASSDPNGADHHLKDSHTARLKHILDEPALRSLFREFLRDNFCEENLSFWLDVQDFKRRFNTTSSAVAAPGLSGKGATKTQGLQAMEKHQQDLIGLAFIIYNTYLAPASPCELNIDHNLRAELVSYMNQVTSDKDAGVKGRIEPGVGNTLHASQLQGMMRLYERIQTYIFRLMATDSVPKFCKTERFLSVMRKMFDQSLDDATNQMGGLGMGKDDDGGSPTRAYLTISQAANEKLAALQKERERERTSHS